MILGDLHSLAWPSLNAELSRLVVTDECMLSHCCEILQGRVPDASLDVLNETDWCRTNVNMTISCDDGRPAPSSCVPNDATDGTNALAFLGCLFVEWMLGLVPILHARRWGATVMKETNCCLFSGGAEAKAATAKDTAAALAPGTVSISVAVPAGASAGDKIQIQHEGASYDVIVPAGVAEGQAFVVALPSPAPKVLLPTRDASQNQRLSVRVSVDSLPPADSLRL